MQLLQKVRDSRRTTLPEWASTSVDIYVVLCSICQLAQGSRLRRHNYAEVPKAPQTTMIMKVEIHK